MVQINNKTRPSKEINTTPLDADFFRRLAEQLPCYICIFNREGRLLYINPAMLKGIGAPDAAFMIGHFNAFDWHGDDFEAYKLPKKLEKALAGEVEFAITIPAPVHEELSSYQATVSRQFASVCTFPIARDDGKIEEAGVLFFPHTMERADPYVMKCRVWIDRHWKEPLDLEALAKSLSVSKYALSNAFKRAMGLTPFQYYRRVRMENVRKKLEDSRFSISQAFEACGMKYNGSMASEFKKMFGQSPKQYRKSL